MNRDKIRNPEDTKTSQKGSKIIEKQKSKTELLLGDFADFHIIRKVIRVVLNQLGL